MNDEELLRDSVTRLSSKYGRYVYKRITALLNQEDWKVNHKRFFGYGEQKDLR